MVKHSKRYREMAEKTSSSEPLDLEAAVEMEMVRWNVDDRGLARALCDTFAFADWVQWFTDYV